jgi:hypothetical protein
VHLSKAINFFVHSFPLLDSTYLFLFTKKSYTAEEGNLGLLEWQIKTKIVVPPPCLLIIAENDIANRGVN